MSFRHLYDIFATCIFQTIDVREMRTKKITPISESYPNFLPVLKNVNAYWFPTPAKANII